MTNLETFIQNYSNSLANQDAKRLPFNQLELHTDSGSFDDVPADADIQATMERLKMMKIKQIELCTKEMFLRRVLKARTLDDAIPSAQEVAQLDLSLGKEKSKLRAIKASRATAEKSLADIARTIDSATASRERVRSEALQTLHKARAASRMQHVKYVLETGNDQDLDMLVRDVDGLDLMCCQLILRELRSQKGDLEKEASSQSTRSENLRREVNALGKDVEQMEAKRISLQEEIAEKGRNDSAMAEVRQRWTMMEKLEEVISALLGFRIIDIRDNAITLGINASVFAKKGDMSASTTEITHTLDVEFDTNELGDVVIAHMLLDPPDLLVSDLVRDLNLSMERGIQIVFSRFMRLYEASSTNP